MAGVCALCPTSLEPAVAQEMYHPICCSSTPDLWEGRACDHCTHLPLKHILTCVRPPPPKFDSLSFDLNNALLDIADAAECPLCLLFRHTIIAGTMPEELMALRREKPGIRINLRASLGFSWPVKDVAHYPAQQYEMRLVVGYYVYKIHIGRVAYGECPYRSDRAVLTQPKSR